MPADYFTKHPTQLRQELDLALIRADVLGPVTDPTRRPMIKVNSVSGTDYLRLPGTTVENPITCAPLPSNKRASRFYVKRRIIVGNMAKAMGPNELFDPSEGPLNNEEGLGPSHKWQVYLKSPKDAKDKTEDINSFVKAVRFFLHPSYRPNNIVDVTRAPLQLIRVGWGEFPVRIQIHFWDSRNKPVEIVHFIRVLTANPNRMSTVSEMAYDLDLDRFTDFSAGLSHFQASTPVTLPPPEADNDAQSKVSDEDVLLMTINEFPLGGKRGKSAAAARYKPVPSMEEFLRMDIVDQRTQEQRRALALCNHLMRNFPSFTKTPEEVLQWSRQRGFTPASVANLVTALEASNVPFQDLFFCRFCGLAHLPQEKFDVLQRNCSSRPRKIHVSSRSSSTDLFSKYVMLPDQSDIVKKQRNDYFGTSFMSFIPFSSNDLADEKINTKGALLQDSSEDTLSYFLDKWILRIISGLHLPPFQENTTSNSFVIHLISRVVRSFLKTLIETSIEQIPDSKERTEDRPVLLTPLHLFNAILGNGDRFDFLSNAHMLGSTLQPGSKAGAAKTAESSGT